MLNTKQLLSALLAAGVLALSGSAGAADFLADRHGARGVECKTCHQTATPAPGAVVSSKACDGCHGGLDKVAERTKDMVPNPHYNHLINTDCQECHKGHQPSQNLCGSCHNLEWKVP